MTRPPVGLPAAVLGGAEGADVEEIAARLAEAPPDKFVAAIAVLTRVSANPEVLAILDQARGRLRDLRPPRPLSLKRQFYTPFEELLTSARESRRGRISRPDIERVWAKLGERSPVAIQGFQNELAALAEGDQPALAAFSARFWHFAADELRPAWKEAPAGLDLIVGALGGGPEIEIFRQRNPGRGLEEFDADAVALILESVKNLHRRGVAFDAYFFVVATRLASPAKLSGILQAAEVLVPAGVAAEIDAMATEDIATRGQWLAEQAPTLSPDAFAQEASRLMRSLVETRSAVGAAGRAELEKRAKAITPALRKILKTQVIDVALPTIDAALAANPEKSAILAGESHARALRRSRQAAQQLGLGSESESVIERIDARLRRDIEAALQRRNQPGEPPGLPDAGFFRNLRMLELLIGSREVAPLMARVTGRKSE